MLKIIVYIRYLSFYWHLLIKDFIKIAISLNLILKIISTILSTSIKRSINISNSKIIIAICYINFFGSEAITDKKIDNLLKAKNIQTLTKSKKYNFIKFKIIKSSILLVFLMTKARLVLT